MYATLVKAVIDLALLVHDIYRDWRKQSERDRRRAAPKPQTNGAQQCLLDAVPEGDAREGAQMTLAAPYDPLEIVPAVVPYSVIPQPPPPARQAVLDDSSSSGSSTPPPAPDPDAGRRATQRFDYFDVDGLDEVAAEAAPLQDEIDDTRHFTDMRTRNVHRSEEAQQLLDAWLTYDPHRKEAAVTSCSSNNVASTSMSERRRKAHSLIDDLI